MNTKDYIIVLQDLCCIKCNCQYTDINHNWCKPCQKNDLIKDFTNWTSGNEDIDNLIKEMQLKINSYNDLIFEFIPYDQFNELKLVGEGGFAKVYLAIWKDGPLDYDKNKKMYIRNQKEVALKCLHNSQNITKEFLNEVYNFNYYYFNSNTFNNN
jgi:hypothetical protein